MEKTTNFDEIESKIQSNDYTWNDFLADIACIINNSLFLFKVSHVFVLFHIFSFDLISRNNQVKEVGSLKIILT